MNSRMHPASTGLRLALATVLAITAASAASAATEDANAAAQPVEEIQELDEIWVRGQRTADAITAAEDDFFTLYNRLNKVQAFRISCDEMYLQRRNMAMQRQCLPAYIVDIVHSQGTPSTYYSTGCNRVGDYMTSVTFSCNSGPLIWVGSASRVRTVLSPARREEYAANVMKVISSNPGLLEKAHRLASLYQEMESTQRHFVEVRKTTGQRLSSERQRNTAGPRTL